MGLDARTAGMGTLAKHYVTGSTGQIIVADVLREETLAGAQLEGDGPDTPHVAVDLPIMTCAEISMHELMDEQRDPPVALKT